MDEAIFNLLLTSKLGLSLPGTLRYQFADPEVEMPAGDFTAMLAESLERPRVQLSAFALKGTLSVPLLSGWGSVPITGTALVSPAAPLTTLFNGADRQRPVNLQFNSFNLRDIFGGLVWRQGQPGQIFFSVLGTPLPFGLRETDAAVA